MFHNYLKKNFKNIRHYFEIYIQHFLIFLNILEKHFNFFGHFSIFWIFYENFLKKCPPPEKILATPKLAANLSALRLKTNEGGNFWQILNFHKKFSMENWFYTEFLSHPPAPLSFYTALQNNTIFLPQFFDFIAWTIPSHLPLRAPC